MGIPLGGAPTSNPPVGVSLGPPAGRSVPTPGQLLVPDEAFGAAPDGPKLRTTSAAQAVNQLERSRRSTPILLAMSAGIVLVLVAVVAAVMRNGGDFESGDDTKVAVGNLAASKKSAFIRCSSSLATPVRMLGRTTRRITVGRVNGRRFSFSAGIDVENFAEGVALGLKPVSVCTDLLTGDGYAKNADGLWAKDGKTVDIRWVVNASNTRRISTQEYLIPLLKTAGFNVKADNCDSACYFQKRLPAGDYDLAMYISTAPPDPAYLTSSFTADNIPSEANGNSGQNFQWWSNDQATTDLHTADKTVDPAKRTELILDAITQMDKDYIMLPLFQFPKSGAYRTDKLDAAAEAQLNNYMAFYNTFEWADKDGDGQIVIGAEQWPGCLNPITECANSSWYVWTVAFPTGMGVYDTTNEGEYVVTPMMASEPVVEIL